jgi:hypothetical protein
MNIHGKFRTIAKAQLLQWATTHMGEYREADNRDEFCFETLDEFVEETFNNDHDHWYDFSPQTLTIDDIQALLMTHAHHCEHQKEELDFIVPPPDCIHDLLVNYGYFKATHDDREHLQAMTRQVFQDLDAVVALLEAEH